MPAVEEISSLRKECIHERERRKPTPAGREHIEIVKMLGASNSDKSPAEKNSSDSPPKWILLKYSKYDLCADASCPWLMRNTV